MRAAFLMIFIIISAPLSFTYFDEDVLVLKNNVRSNENETVGLHGLNGSGVIITVADTGIDLDHSCFRNSSNEIGEPGLQHRKIIYLNDTLDDWDNQGHQQFRHGTHIAGILACDQLDGDSSMRSLSNGARLVVQDIVNTQGWVPPEDVTSLLAESARFGAVINSWSWGDNSVEYTNRSKMIDEYTSENPWSLVFVAPGNNGGMILEPSNAYNVVSVAASDSEENGSVWQSSSHGPDINGRRGNLIASPGINIVSAKADGTKFGFNNESYAMTGTSMSTPMAASFAAILQEFVETEYSFTPSAPLLRAMLASSAEGLTGNNPDAIQGYGRPDISSFDGSIFIHDSYGVENWSSLITSRGETLEQLKSNPWNGSGAAGPFLSENESWGKMFKPVEGEDVEVVMSYNARSSDYQIDDLRLIVRTDDGRFAIDDQLGNSGFSQMYYQSWASPLSLNSSNETTVMVRIPYSSIKDVEWLEVEVVANKIHNGTNQGMLGLEGTKLGFGLVATGVENLTQNLAPTITMLDGPAGGENYTENISVTVSIEDVEMDGYVVAFRMINGNFSVDLGDCAVAYNYSNDIDCLIVVSKDLVPLAINRHDWRIEIVAADDNNSVWTSPKFSTLSTANFTVWWTSPLLEEEPPRQEITTDDTVEQNRVFLWGVIGVVLGAIVAAGVMFRRFENRVLDGVPPPFVEEE
ncbi:MAG: hypothetical protein DWC06_03205 [Candidatus Poseidoniales archaeon]|nr:MAG: hypothetical protein DWC06_03205 [Candidatus Poseidoniales archaeon]